MLFLRPSPTHGPGMRSARRTVSLCDNGNTIEL